MKTLQAPEDLTTKLFLITTPLRVVEELADNVIAFTVVVPSFIVIVLDAPDVSVIVIFNTENPADGVNIVVSVLADTLVSDIVIGTGTFHAFPSYFNSLK